MSSEEEAAKMTMKMISHHETKKDQQHHRPFPHHHGSTTTKVNKKFITTVSTDDTTDDEEVLSETIRTLTTSSSFCRLDHLNSCDNDESLSSSSSVEESEYVVPKLCHETLHEARSSFNINTTTTTTTSSDPKSSTSSELNKTKTTTLPPPRKQVRFDHVTIRRYCIIIGDNPSCHIGPPISIGWEYEELPNLDITAYEQTRSKQRRSSGGKHLHNLLLSYYHRYGLLLRLGYEESEINKAEKVTDKIRFQRSITKTIIQIPTLGKIEEMTQSLKRKVVRRCVISKGGGRREKRDIEY